MSAPSSLWCTPCVHSWVPESVTNVKQSQLPYMFSRQDQSRGTTLQVYAIRSPKGFGPVPKRQEEPVKIVEKKKVETALETKPDEEQDEVVPEVVTNRMLRRIGFTVGIPFAVGIAVFPLFYYLKVVQKLDVPEWLPLLTSMVTFGSAGAGITYGVLSASWDPSREGSLLGWKEVQLNWPAFWQTLKGKEGSK